MKNALILTENQTHFLAENRQDPITGDGFFVGDEIVFCASCKSAFLKESWEYMDKKHCNQNKMLSNFPIASYLFLTKAIISKFEKADKNARVFAYLVDCLIGVVLGFLVAIFMNYFIIAHKTFLYAVGTFIFYILFKDVLLKNQSIGKCLFGIYFSNKKENKENVFVACLFRNIIYWLISGSITYLFFRGYSFDSIYELSYCIYFGFTLHAIYILMMLLENNLFDIFFGIELVQEKNKYNQ